MLALLSKEAAFCLPLLAVCLIPLDPQSYRRTLKSAGALALLCCAVFAYRLWFLGGIGGYRTSAGMPVILSFSLLRTAKALFYRQWAILSWPVNWSLDLNSFLKFGFILMVAASLLAIADRRPKRTVFGACIALVLAAALPAQQLLLIGADLAGARVLYLPTLGIALLWGVLLENSTKWQAGALLSGGLLFFQVAALEHNMTIWKDVARLSHETCASFAKEIGPGEQSVRVRNLPRMGTASSFLLMASRSASERRTGLSLTTGVNLHRRSASSPGATPPTESSQLTEPLRIRESNTHEQLCAARLHPARL